MSGTDKLIRQIGERVHEIRGSRGITQDALALAMRTKHNVKWLNSDISNLERGNKSRLDVSALLALSSVLGVPLSVLLNDSFCPNCHGSPPRRFTCNVCGEGKPEKVPAREGAQNGQAQQ